MLHVSVGWWRGARRRFSRPLLLCALAILVTHCSLLVFCAVEDSPTDNEIGHLPAGLSHWRLGRFGLYAVNPPLVRLIATVPLAVGCVEIPYEGADFVPSHRGEWSVGMDFVRADPPRAVFWFAVARIACLPFAILGGCVCFLWARQLYGRIAGVVALTLWSFSPTVLAYGHLITPDLGAAATGVTAAYGFWRWLKMPTWEWTFVAGLLLGLAELTKTTWIVLFVFWPALWLVWRLTDLAARRGETIKLGAILVLAFLLINVGYGFEGSLQPLEDFKFVSQALTSRSVDGREGLPTEDNRFAGTCLGKVPVPLPMNYLLGIDVQKRDFENKMWSYLNGEWRLGGWWYYYLYALAIKEPLGTWALVLLAAVISLPAWNRTNGNRSSRLTVPSTVADLPKGEVRAVWYSAGWRDELVLLTPAAVVLALVSSQTGFNLHVRYVLPALPFIFVWASKAARSIEFRHLYVAGLAGAALGWSVVSSLAIYPHSLSYFNELAGGPLGGHYHLGSSSTDWGQDLLNLKRWVDAHPEAKPLTVACVAFIDPAMVGIQHDGKPPTDGPSQGWHAVSVNQIHRQERDYEYFLRFRPVDMAGYSIYIYHITPDEANRVRREMRLPLLPDVALHHGFNR